MCFLLSKWHREAQNPKKCMYDFFHTAKYWRVFFFFFLLNFIFISCNREWFGCRQRSVLVHALPLLYARVMPLRYVFRNTLWNMIPKHSWTQKVPSPFCLHYGKNAGNLQQHPFHVRPFFSVYWQQKQCCQFFQISQKIQVILDSYYWNPQQSHHWTAVI